MSIYVEARIRSGMEELWLATQDPARHEPWDLRFTRIEYLPRPDASQPQRFLYATRIGFGLEIRGEGESAGGRSEGSGDRVSALKFWSEDPKSLIRSGSGYWKYVPTGDGIRFLTLYDYEVRFGVLGRLADALVFRPLLGWATAWSFDRLRLWLEKGIPPAVSLRQSLTHAVARTAVGLIWVYQGLVPKVLARHPDELALLAAAGASGDAGRLAVGVGIAETLFGLYILSSWQSRWPFLATIAVMILALGGVAATFPAFLAAPFNPVSFNLGVAALAAAALLSLHDLPLARRCLRRMPEKLPPP